MTVEDDHIVGPLSMGTTAQLRACFRKLAVHKVTVFPDGSFTGDLALDRLAAFKPIAGGSGDLGNGGIIGGSEPSEAPVVPLTFSGSIAR